MMALVPYSLANERKSVTFEPPDADPCVLLEVGFVPWFG